MEGIAICLDDMFEEAENDLLEQAKMARQRINAINSRTRRVSAERAFDREQKQFLASRRANCGPLTSEFSADSARANEIRDCYIRMARERAAEIGKSLGNRPAAQEAPAARSAPRAAADAVYGIDWRLDRLVRDNDEFELPDGYRATVRLDDDGRVSGKGAVNAFSGQYKLRPGGKIEWTQNGLFITRTSGLDEHAGVDQLFIDALERVSRAGLGQDGLVLRNEDGSIVLTFTR